MDVILDTSGAPYTRAIKNATIAPKTQPTTLKIPAPKNPQMPAATGIKGALLKGGTMTEATVMAI